MGGEQIEEIMEKIEIKEGAELGEQVREILVRGLLCCDIDMIVSKKCGECPLDKEVKVVVESTNEKYLGKAEISKRACGFLQEIAHQIQ